ncbi:hypothetical protein Syun_026853 [Stephania yunnanensis]|uniref:F-box associated beta-propeller type 1 domain-containing protein n=1 Tax=Stephania yunnanensis TaxID=152371 RepID=A0AAP0EHU3_9MAGN
MEEFGPSGLLARWGTPSTYVNGSLHWLTQCHKFQQYQDIVRFDLATEQFKKVPGPSSKEFWRRSYSVVELRGCLCAVVHTNNSDTIEVWIMKDYNVKESWAKEFVIPAHVQCRLQTGEFLLEYGNQALVPYDPHQEEFKKLDIHGLPNCFEAITFKGSLLPLQDHTQMQIQLDNCSHH